MDQKTNRRKKSPFGRIRAMKGRNSSSRHGAEHSMNTTVDLRESPEHSPVASPSASSSSFFKSTSLKFSNFSSPASTSTHIESFRVFAATWNVAGKTPDMELNLNDFLPSDDHSDVYVLGFQEVVPLNAGNVLVIEDNEPASRWLALINQALNRTSSSPPASRSFSQSASPASALHTASSSPLDPSLFHKNGSSPREVRRAAITRGRRLKSCTCPAERPPRRRPYSKSSSSCLMMRCGSSKNRRRYAVEGDTTTSDEEDMDVVVDGGGEASSMASDATLLLRPAAANLQRRYCLVACKQMVGLFATVWARRELVAHIGHVRLSCVGRGIMGRLGNKGCISVSMSLHQTSLCFVCSHLASGEKDGDELRRNSDVVEILKNTQFRRVCKRSGRRIPERILDHDRVIWLGDLNYRIALSYAEAKKLVDAGDWAALFEKDQLKTEREGGVFRGWSEAVISFAPTYKYSWNSDSYYVGEDDDGAASKKKTKRRTPAWCDRILWRGDGIVQVAYVRGESKFSDHRPVCGAFIVDIAVLDGAAKMVKLVAATASMKVGAEELLLPRQT
ncbi:type I inositol polyphosphate 5-phosphatase 10 [Aegilops tauschii subsp. strangulata]|uniref:Inositol polyphosphate-related phosphatase domain-containing protein n=3 Tax=Aegilops tauschii subsp. strangulata TaxID=200361 RepID=A0A453HQD0_AEGTS|nr:type I inositol polyphosphate 5-phosphatase 10 [Aegilops tauschii subsp. strangulata]XP_020150742.1 type I inositol polyphosphate 5-phosphatase 10 [Aegilops tauschii subsp. strangulata]XP_020150748.1 type I inositol polyphosphate 5-phosphatase 10 [Aegilops tauschii subsp. strangulata]XP_040242741.1 type I inositol polyphosphate 5-phosphatase 10 [Aegilops tauschii subsp. strangulata]